MAKKKKSSRKTKPKKIGLIKGNKFLIPRYIAPKQTLWQKILQCLGWYR